MVLTAVAVVLELDIRTVGDMGELPDSLPVFLLPDVPLNLETLAIIFPYSLTLMVVGLARSKPPASKSLPSTFRATRKRSSRAKSLRAASTCC